MVDPTKTSNDENDRSTQQQTFTRRDSIRLTAGTVLGGIAADAALNETSGGDLAPNPQVRNKLEALKHRIPGRITAPDQTELRTAISGQLVVIRDRFIIIQVGPNAYELALDNIEDIFDAQNPTEVERKTGVDVVVFLKSNRATVRTQVQNLLPRPEVPLALDVETVSPSLAEFQSLLNNNFVQSVNQPLIEQLPATVSADLVARTQRWEALNDLLGELNDPLTAGREQCTIEMSCKTWTKPIFGPIVCDLMKADACVGF